MNIRYPVCCMLGYRLKKTTALLFAQIRRKNVSVSGENSLQNTTTSPVGGPIILDPSTIVWEDVLPAEENPTMSTNSEEEQTMDNGKIAKNAEKAMIVEPAVSL